VYFVTFYVDDGGIIGTPEAIEEVIEALVNHSRQRPTVKCINMPDVIVFDTTEMDEVQIHQQKYLRI
jgi:hypothetical protein